MINSNSTATTTISTTMNTTTTPTDANDIEKGNSTATPTKTNAPQVAVDPVIDQGFLKPIQQTTPIEKAVGIVAFIAIVLALFAIIIEQSLIVIIAGILSIIISPYSYYQQTQLTDIRTLQETKVVLGTEIDKLENENKRLVSNIDQITESIDKLNDIDSALSVITSKQGATVATFKEHVEENRTILQSMQGNLKATILQNLLSILLRTDIDKNSKLDNNEIDSLFKRLKNISPSLIIHEDRFRAAIASKEGGGTIKHVMDIVKDVVNNETIPVNERIFDFKQTVATTTTKSE